MRFTNEHLFPQTVRYLCFIVRLLKFSGISVTPDNVRKRNRIRFVITSLTCNPRKIQTLETNSLFHVWVYRLLRKLATTPWAYWISHLTHKSRHLNRANLNHWDMIREVSRQFEETSYTYGVQERPARPNPA